MMGIEPMTSSLPRKRSTPELHRLVLFLTPCFKAQKGQKPQAHSACEFWAGDRVRTGDIQLGRLTLYQLSYSRRDPKFISGVIYSMSNSPLLPVKRRAKIIKNESFTKNKSCFPTLIDSWLTFTPPGNRSGSVNQFNSTQRDLVPKFSKIWFELKLKFNLWGEQDSNLRR